MGTQTFRLRSADAISSLVAAHESIDAFSTAAAEAATSVNDWLAGDAEVPAGARVALAAEAANAEESVDGVDAEIATVALQTLNGLAGDDTVAGDVLAGSGGTVGLLALAGAGGEVSAAQGAIGAGRGGDSGQLTAFDDQLLGGLGDDRLVGDVFSAGKGLITLTADSGRGGSSSVALSGLAGNADTIRAFNDTLLGGDGNDLIVGDVHRAFAIGDITLDALAGTGADAASGIGADGGTDAVVRAFDDSLIGTSGDDTLVGDVFGISDSGVVHLAAAAGDGGDGSPGGNGGGDGRIFAFDDTLRGGDGGDVMIGDVYRLFSHDRAEILVSAGGGGTAIYGEIGTTIAAEGGSGHFDRAAMDVLFGVNGDDVLVGDVAHVSASGDVSLTAEAGSGATLPSDAGVGGNGGSDNDVGAFHDLLSGGNGADLIVGDARGLDDDGAMTLLAAAGSGGVSSYGTLGGDGGDANRTSGFNDTLDGGGGADTLAGDVLSDHASGTILLAASAGCGGYGYDRIGGTGGANNTAAAFNDILTGGDGNDVLVGDLAASFADGAPFELTRATLSVRVGAQGAAGAANGGADNVVQAFDDTLAGGNGDDLLVGDVFLAIDTLDQRLILRIDAAGDAGNQMTAFRDRLDGGDGNDTLYGDFFDGAAGFSALLSPGGTFGGLPLMFADTLAGGGGDDVIAGGLGTDTLSGGGGADRFVWTLDDLSFAPGLPPVDTITDFDLNDTLDLSGYFAAFNFPVGVAPDATYISLRVDGGATIVGVNASGGPSHDDFVRLAGFTTALDVQDLIDSGVILIA
ncbi:MAG: calcium-binding protein [Rhodospirillales bacterium]|nr:calcium-binding protein [Rhodospirillales bacterium]